MRINVICFIIVDFFGIHLNYVSNYGIFTENIIKNIWHFLNLISLSLFLFILS